MIDSQMWLYDMDTKESPNLIILRHVEAVLEMRLIIVMITPELQ